MRTRIVEEQKGITLIALVITIVVLLILAGVTISMLSGENGILKQAAEAKTKTENQKNIEQIKLAILATMTNTEHKIDIPKLNEELEKIGYNRGKKKEDGTYPNDIKSLPAMVEINGATYTISNEGVEEKGKWRYAKDENGRKTIITNGVLELKIGEYINYNAAATDAGETIIEEKTVTSNKGSPTATGYYKASEQTVTEGNGASNQTFSNKATTNGWRVLGVDEETGEILIISADRVKTKGNENFYIRGIAGYNYGVQELNKVCSVFKNGYGATGARSVNVDDVNKITGYNPNNIGKYDPEQKEIGTKVSDYGKEITYSWTQTQNQITSVIGKGSHYDYKTYGFNWYDELTKTWKTSMQDTSNPVEIGKLTSSYYYYFPYSLTTNKETTGTQNGLSATSDEYLTLFCNKAGTNVSYWLASPYVCTYTAFTYFGLRLVSSSGGVGCNNLYCSGGKVWNSDCGVRPVVSLKSDIKLQYDKTKAYYDIIG